MNERVDLFVEDAAHRIVLSVIVERTCAELDIDPELRWRNTSGGYGAVSRELAKYVRDLRRRGSLPDAMVIGTDGNSLGQSARKKEIGMPDLGIPVVYAIPEPHIERWLLLDGQAFKSVLGKGCQAPDMSWDRDRYKQVLADQVAATGVTPVLGGLEFAEDIMRAVDFERAGRMDRSFRQFVSTLKQTFTAFSHPLP